MATRVITLEMYIALVVAFLVMNIDVYSSFISILYRNYNYVTESVKIHIVSMYTHNFTANCNFDVEIVHFWAK